MEWKLEVVPIPVSDVDRAKRFYGEQVGFTVDHDTRIGDDMRIVQLTPPGSACSIAIGTGLVDSAPGSLQGLQLVVPDIEAARAELVGRGLAVSEIRHFASGEWQPGPDPEHRRYNSFADFSDPDGNTWLLQEVRRG